jgi:adenylate cyclase
MAARLDALNREMPARKEIAWPASVEIGIGLEAGPCCVGNMGSAQRLSYSLIGDTVNLASRIEGLTKSYGVRIAIGEDLAARLADFALVELDRVRVVGRERPATVHALVGDEALAGSSEFAAFRAAHEKLLAAYRGRRWPEAEKRIAGREGDAARYGLAALYALYRERVRACAAAPPPADSDGVFTAKEK